MKKDIIDFCEKNNQIREGSIGMHLSSGEQVLTSTNRKTTPFPVVDTSTTRKENNTLRRVNQWLIDNARQESISRGDHFNNQQFNCMSASNMSQSDKDSAEYYLFDRDNITPIVRSSLRKIKQSF